MHRNLVAAQSARDRKKLRFLTPDSVYKDLELSNFPQADNAVNSPTSARNRNCYSLCSNHNCSNLSLKFPFHCCCTHQNIDELCQLFDVSLFYCSPFPWNGSPLLSWGLRPALSNPCTHSVEPRPEVKKWTPKQLVHRILGRFEMSLNKKKNTTTTTTTTTTITNQVLANDLKWHIDILITEVASPISPVVSLWSPCRSTMLLL